MQASKVGSILCIDQRIATLITPMLLVQYMEAYIHRNMNSPRVPPTSIHQLTDVDIQYLTRCMFGQITSCSALVWP